ncbi:hypothetical protein [Estrella lausannensis]|uniref:Uncharacterized protein n=1 Tax=Estrella lausannensis TaxID=483423 RepID=A0A0H5DRQ2_9BACT|nr:hypothetical protein [Estrella lausannensis]CRX39282.1 Hypothetical protein ELAC_1960 [Estrella lausannensis]
MDPSIQSRVPQTVSFQTPTGESSAQNGVPQTSGEQHTSNIAHDMGVTPDEAKTSSLHQGDASSHKLASPDQAQQSQPTDKTLSAMLKSAFQTVKGGLGSAAATTAKAILSAGRGVSDFARDLRNEFEAGNFIDNRKAQLSGLADKASQKTGIGLDSKIQKLETSTKQLDQQIASDKTELNQLKEMKDRVTTRRDNASSQSLKGSFQENLDQINREISKLDGRINMTKTELTAATSQLKELQEAKGSSMLTNASRMAGNLKPLAQGLAGRIGIIKHQRPTSQNDEQLSAAKAELAKFTKADDEIYQQLKDLQGTLSKYPENPSNPEQAKMKSSIKKQVQTLINQRSANTKTLESMRENIQKMQIKQTAEETTFREQNPTLIGKAVSTATTVSSAVSSALQSIKGLTQSDNLKAPTGRISTALGDLKEGAGKVAEGARKGFEALRRGIRDLLVGKKGESDEGTGINKSKMTSSPASQVKQQKIEMAHKQVEEIRAKVNSVLNPENSKDLMGAIALVSDDRLNSILNSLDVDQNEIKNSIRRDFAEMRNSLREPALNKLTALASQIVSNIEKFETERGSMTDQDIKKEMDELRPSCAYFLNSLNRVKSSRINPPGESDLAENFKKIHEFAKENGIQLQ